MVELRPYQKQAVNSIEPWLENNDGNGLIVMATGTGKSITMASFIKDICQKYKDTRILSVTHVADLVQGNHDALKDIWPECDSGIYSVKLKKKDKNNQILFGMLQSIYNKAYKIQQCDILLIDEVHTVSRKAKSMWGKFIQEMLTINPYMRIVGFSATEYRMDSGNLTSGDDAMFKDIIYEYGLLEAINEGYLCEIIPKSMTTKIDLTGVGKRGGEFIANELEAAIDIDWITKSAVKELIEYGHDRKTWMIFCSGIKHCQHVCDEIRSHGISCEIVIGETPQEERERIYSALKNGSLRSVCSVAVMTTGTNIPNIDLIGGLRPTGSAGLLVQMAGRGTRLSPGKKNCLYLDWSGNISRHGPLDKIRGRDKQKSGDGIPPMKTCPDCATVVYAGVRTCPDCGFNFPEPEVKINAVSDNIAVLSTQKIYEWHNVEEVSYSRNAKPGKIPSLRVDYYTGLYSRVSEWIFFEHTGYSREKAISWWKARSNIPVPNTVDEALKHVNNFDSPTKILAHNPSDRSSFPHIKEYVYGKKEKEQDISFEDDDLYAWTAPKQPEPDNQFELYEIEIPF